MSPVPCLLPCPRTLLSPVGTGQAGPGLDSPGSGPLGGRGKGGLERLPVCFHRRAWDGRKAPVWAEGYGVLVAGARGGGGEVTLPGPAWGLSWHKPPCGLNPRVLYGKDMGPVQWGVAVTASQGPPGGTGSPCARLAGSSWAVHGASWGLPWAVQRLRGASWAGVSAGTAPCGPTAGPAPEGGGVQGGWKGLWLWADPARHPSPSGSGGGGVRGGP